jgi:hypothetical protein
MWRNAAGSVGLLIDIPPGSELWYDDRDIPFLLADASDGADIQLTKATAIRLLVDSGYEPDSVIDAIESDDFTLLNHSGLYSVQLQAPSSTQPPSVQAGWQPTPGGPQPQLPSGQNENDGGPTPTSGPGSPGNGKPPGLPAGGKRATIAGNVTNPQDVAQALIAARRRDRADQARS